MNQAQYPITTRVESVGDVPNEVDSNESWHWYHLLPLIAIASFIFTPFLIWRIGVPGGLRWVGDLAVMGIIVLAFARMFTKNKIPAAFLVILALSILGIILASFEDQHPAATLWGWWTIFRYPMVGLFVYLVPNWPKSFARKLPWIGVMVLATQLLLQLFLFALGMDPGDRLAGSFGPNGTGSLILLIILVVALALGKWLVEGDWKPLIIAVLLGSVSSVLGEMKLFAIGLPLIAALTILLFIIRRGFDRRLFLFFIFASLTAVTFINGYNRIIADVYGKPRIESYLDEDSRIGYDRDLQRSNRIFQLGRNGSMNFALQVIQRDLPTTLFGMGLGTGQIASTFGFIGAGFNQTVYGVVIGGTGLMVILIEFGYLGLIIIGGLMIFTFLILFRATRRDPDPEVDIVRYAVMLFTLLWPLWLYYNSSWFLPAPTMIYWFLWGYAMHFSIPNKTSNTVLAHIR